MHSTVYYTVSGCHVAPAIDSLADQRMIGALWVPIKSWVMAVQFMEAKHTSTSPQRLGEAEFPQRSGEMESPPTG